MNHLESRREFLVRSGALGGASLASGAKTFAGDRDDQTAPLAPFDRQPPELTLPNPPVDKVGWAIVGLGQLALGEIMPAFAGCQWSQPVALVSCHPAKAGIVAAAYGIRADAVYDYESFDRLAEDKHVEVIYIVLPNSMHADFTIRGLRAGKHVLCEKPMAMNVAECESMIAAAKTADRQLGVAYRLHSEPLNRKVMELCKDRKLGSIKSFSSSNCQNVEAPNIRLSAGLGGGSVGDVGIYSINAARYVTGEEPVEVTAFSHQPQDDPRFREVPESFVFTLRFPSGVLATCDCSFGVSESRRYRVHCAEGLIEMDPAFSYRGLRLRTQNGKAEGEQFVGITEILIEQVNHFTAQIDHFSEVVRNATPLRTPGEMGLADMRVVTAIHEAARTGRAIRV